MSYFYYCYFKRYVLHATTQARKELCSIIGKDTPKIESWETEMLENLKINILNTKRNNDFKLSHLSKQESEKIKKVIVK